MPEVAVNTPLADALNGVIQPKLVEVGWGTGGNDDAALSEYIILMLVNGKTESQIAEELSGELLNLGPDDPAAVEFAKWLFEEVERLDRQLGGGPGQEDGGAMEISDPNDPGPSSNTEVGLQDVGIPTGPKALRNGSTASGGRGKRLMNHISKAMDRSHESALHRTRGNDRISSHSRGPPTGPRMGMARGGRAMPNGRAQSIAAGLATMGQPPMIGTPGPPMSGPWMAPGQPGPMTDMLAFMQHQTQVIEQMQNMIAQTGMAAQPSFNQHGQGKPLSERVHHAGRAHMARRGRGDHFHQNGRPSNPAEDAKGDVSMGDGTGDDTETQGDQPKPTVNPEDTVCKYNLRCTNPDCKFAHQSPAAPPGTAVDVNDVCTFAAACKNRKCVGRHPSPATRAAHQSEMDCKFYPNCQNPRCPFRHPTMPPCRNGGDCTVPNCKFTHVKTPCKFHPCTNRFCPFMHEEGQRGVFHDKVWTAGEGGPGGKDHVSERKFVADDAPEEVVLPDAGGEQHGPAGVDVATA